MDGLYYATAVFLVLGWIVLELVRQRRSQAGVIVRVLDDEVPLASLLRSHVVVRLEDGREVAAIAGGCVRCQNGLVPGSRVLLLKQNDQYVVSLPSWRSSDCRTDKRA